MDEYVCKYCYDEYNELKKNSMILLFMVIILVEIK